MQGAAGGTTSIAAGPEPRAPRAEAALACCLRAADGRVPWPERTRLLERLELDLPRLDLGEVAWLLRQPAYLRVRRTLCAARSALWFEQECRLAEDVLASGAPDPLTGLFDTHIPEEAYAPELSALRPHAPRRILIVGSGPCPMTAYVLHLNFPGAEIVALDRSERACGLAGELLARSGPLPVTVRNGDVCALSDIRGFDCVLMALGVGDDAAEKAAIVRHLAGIADPDAVLAARTAVGWSRIMYSWFDLPALLPADAGAMTLPEDCRAVIVPVRFADLERR